MAERSVQNNIVYSSDMPRMWIQVSEAFQYVGNLKIILKGIAWADIYYFVHADGATLKRTFHVQFEGYLPDNDYVYRYPSQEYVRLGNWDYQYDAAFWSPIDYVHAHPDSDVAHGHQLLMDKGYDADGVKDVMRERYVRVLDDAKRNEVLFIYTENLNPYGLTASDLGNNDAANEWPRLRAEMHEHARQSFQVFHQPPPSEHAAG